MRLIWRRRMWHRSRMTPHRIRFDCIWLESLTIVTDSVEPEKKPVELEQQLHTTHYDNNHLNPVYGYNYGYVQSPFNPHQTYFPNGCFQQYVPVPNNEPMTSKVKYRKGQPKKQRLLSGQNDSFTRSDISTETTSTTNTSYSRGNSRKNPKAKKTPR